MRLLALSAIIFAISAPAAVQAAPQIHVTVSPALQAKAKKTYGVVEIDRLAGRLRERVASELARTGALSDATVELTLVDARANRPTFKQLGDRPGLSLQSFGVGGADVQGRVIAANGAVTPVSYRWYETDISQAVGRSTWGDAEWTLDSFARRLARGDQVASR